MGTEIGQDEAFDGCDDPGMFLELGVNRLARDLFLLTATSAFFIALLTSVPLRILADRTWNKEARVVEDAAQAGPVLSLHLRKDGSILVGREIAFTPEEAAAIVKKRLGEKPDALSAKVILNTYKNTPSIFTSDVTVALAGVGLDPRRFYLRFTEE